MAAGCPDESMQVQRNTALGTPPGGTDVAVKVDAALVGELAVMVPEIRDQL